MLSYLSAWGLRETVNPHTISPTQPNNQHSAGPTLQGLFTYLEKEEATIPQNPTKCIRDILHSIFDDT